MKDSTDSLKTPSPSSSSLPPLWVIQAFKSISWRLDGSVPMQYRSLEHLGTPALPYGGEMSVADMLASLSNNRGTYAQKHTDHWARIVVALILLGHGYLDHAHDLVGTLSYTPPPFEYYYQSTPSGDTPDASVESAASLAHALVHRAEGPRVGELGLTGYQNSDFWTGAALRSIGDESLPLDQMRHHVQALAMRHGSDAQEWWRTHVAPYDEYDSRAVTALCALCGYVMRQQKESQAERMVCNLQAFVEEAALVELKVLLEYALRKCGFAIYLLKE